MGTGAKVAIGCVVAVCLACTISCCVFFVWTGTGNEGGVRYSNNLERYATEYMEAHHVLEAGETVVAYYDASMSLDASELAILTDRRVIHVLAGHIEAIPLAAIRNVTKTSDGINTIILVLGPASSIAISVAPLNGGDQFHDVIVASWRSAQAPITEDAGTDGSVEAQTPDAGVAEPR